MWCALVNMVLNLEVAYNARNVLTSWRTAVVASQGWLCCMELVHCTIKTCIFVINPMEVAKLMLKLLMETIWCNIMYQTKCLFIPPMSKTLVCWVYQIYLRPDTSSCSRRFRHVSCSLILKMKLVPPSLPRSSYVPLSLWFIL